MQISFLIWKTHFLKFLKLHFFDKVDSEQVLSFPFFESGPLNCPPFLGRPILADFGYVVKLKILNHNLKKS